MLIECVPNISEGRRPEVIGSIASAVGSVSGVALLDTSSDPDHNRSVITFAGEPDSLIAAIRALYAAALPAIDLTRHSGAHPRIGAVDVVPFIPLAGSTMADCIALAHEAAAVVAAEFSVPVFLYAEAAMSSERRKLSEIRRGGFEGLGKMVEPAWMPDFGPSAPHPTAGASAIGARDFLIAYNIQLESSDVRIAREVSRQIRESSGGMNGVQAMGVFLATRNQAQVSMNLLDFRSTPLDKVYHAVERLARRYGTRVVASELVGLIPQAALTVPPEELKIENWRPTLILENALAARKVNPSRHNAKAL